jgi:hypothetical protein
MGGKAAKRGSKKPKYFGSRMRRVEEPEGYEELPDIDPRTSVKDAFRWLELALPFTESGWQLKKSR